MTRPSCSPAVRPGHLIDPIPIIIYSFDSKDNPPIINSTNYGDNIPKPAAASSIETESSSGFGPVPSPENVPFSKPTPRLGIVSLLGAFRIF